MARWIVVGVLVWVAITTIAFMTLMHERVDDDGEPLPSPSPSLSPSPTPSRTMAATISRHPTRSPRQCHSTRGSPHWVTDDRGYTCRWDALDAATGCCADGLLPSLRSCHECARGCCRDYAFCVGCCMSRTRTFTQCAARCHTDHRALDAHGRYTGDAHFCWDAKPAESARPKTHPLPF